MESFFQPSIDCIVNAVLDLRNTYIKVLFRCGGFSATDWLFENVQSLLAPVGLNVLRPEH